MLQFGLTEKDREQLEYPKRLFSGFGRDPNDFIHFYVYDMEDNLLEDDILNLKIIPHPQGILTLFGQIPLFISRVKPDIRAGESLSDVKNFQFVLKEKSRLYYLLGEKPICLFHRQDKMESLGISNHLIDLSFYQPSRKFFKALTYQYQNKQKTPDSILFNHKAGFK